MISNDDRKCKNDDVIIGQLTKYIVSHNMKKLSLFFENMNSYEKFLILKKNESIEQLLKQNKWNKGLKLFALVVAKHKHKHGVTK